MPQMRRRNTLIGLGTIVFGGSGFIASGAFEFGSEGSTGGSDWVRVANVEEAVDDDDDDDGEDVSADDDDEDDTEPDDDDDDEEEPEPSQILILHAPDGTGSNFTPQGGATYARSPSDSDYLQSDGEGFLESFSVANANRNAVSRIGGVDSNGYPNSPIAFVVVNAGPAENPGQAPGEGARMAVRMELLNSNGAPLGTTDQLRFPYRVIGQNRNTQGRGSTLQNETIHLAPGQFIEVVIEIDARNGTDDIENIATLQFTSSPAGGN